MIKNIIFDLGGVLLNLDIRKTQNAFIELGMVEFKAHYTQAKQSGLFDLFDCGKITANEFRAELKKHLPLSVTDKQIDFAWNAMLLDLPLIRLELLQNLSKKYRLFLLSNTNEIHVQAFSFYLKKITGKSNFSSYFENWYYSCNIGMRKPNADIFEYALIKNNLITNETMFIDDTIQHVEAAKRLGITGVFLPQGKTIIDLADENIF